MYYRFVMLIALAALVLAGCKHDRETVARLEGKRDHIEEMLVESASNGEDISPYLARMEQAGAHFKEGEIAEGEAVMDAVAAELERELNKPPPRDSEFGPPQRVTIVGFDESLGAMEPFISRDGRLLLFNSQKRGNVEPDMYYAERIDDLTFRYLGPIRGSSSDTVDGAPSMDRANRIYFVSPRNYRDSLDTLYRAVFSDGGIDRLRPVEGDISPKRPGWLNMDAEISADGRTLYYCVNKWDTKNKLPATSEIQVARQNGGRFATPANSAVIFGAVNSDALEYAPALSADERELYFTRAKPTYSGDTLVLARTSIMVARRNAPGEPFGEPRRIESITGFVEGPTITPDGRAIYYHRRDGDRFHLYMVARH